MAAPSSRKSIFTRFANVISKWAGHPAAFLLALLAVAVWAVTGPIFGFGETWQLVINTGTTIVTFLMVFLVQNTQNRDSRALQIKLDELIRVTEKASDTLLDMEELEDRELEEIQRHYEALAATERKKKRGSKNNTAASCPADLDE